MIHVPVRMGGRWAGRVLRYRTTAVETFFFHIWFFPLFPIGSAAVKLDGIKGLNPQRLPVSMSLRSIVAAYLRLYAPLAGGAMLASWWGAWWWYSRWNGGLGVAAITVGVTALGWLIGLGVPAKHRAAMDAWLSDPRVLPTFEEILQQRGLRSD
jgi:hypothetical protein